MRVLLALLCLGCERSEEVHASLKHANPYLGFLRIAVLVPDAHGLHAESNSA